MSESEFRRHVFRRSVFQKLDRELEVAHVWMIGYRVERRAGSARRCIIDALDSRTWELGLKVRADGEGPRFDRHVTHGIVACLSVVGQQFPPALMEPVVLPATRSVPSQ
jgi:hypothetical protein